MLRGTADEAGCLCPQDIVSWDGKKLRRGRLLWRRYSREAGGEGDGQ